MSDIDFDELDRAVASVLTPDPTPAPPTQPAPAPVQPSEPEVTPVAVSVIPKPAPEPVPAPVAAPSVAAPAQALHTQTARPVPRGRFLDMVQPTRPVSVTPSASPAPAAPQAPVVPAPAANGPFMSDVVAPGTRTIATPIPAAPTVTAPVSALASAPTEPKPAVPDFFAASPDDANPHKTPDVAASPFIPDAKVEKRPLGAFASGDDGTPPARDAFHDKLVAVESEDNIVEEDAAPTLSRSAKPAPAAPIVAAPAAAAATLFEPHEKQPKPMKAPKPRPDKAPKYGKGTLIWVTVAIAVMLIGFGVGASLYFLVLQ